MARKTSRHDLLVGLLLVQSLLERKSEEFFQPFGLSGAQFNILNLLAHHGDHLEQSSLVELLLVGKSSVSIVLNRMVRDGLVRRAEHPGDRRRTILHLTPKGNALWHRISPRYEAEVKSIFDHLPETRRQSFLQELRLVHDGLLKGARHVAESPEEHWVSYLSPGKTGK